MTKNVALKSANVLQKGLLVFVQHYVTVSAACSIPLPTVPSSMAGTEQFFQDHGTSEGVCSQAALQE